MRVEGKRTLVQKSNSNSKNWVCLFEMGTQPDSFDWHQCKPPPTLYKVVFHRLATRLTLLVESSNRFSGLRSRWTTLCLRKWCIWERQSHIHAHTHCCTTVQVHNRPVAVLHSGDDLLKECPGLVLCALAMFHCKGYTIASTANSRSVTIRKRTTLIPHSWLQRTSGLPPIDPILLTLTGRLGIININYRGRSTWASFDSLGRDNFLEQRDWVASIGLSAYVR